MVVRKCNTNGCKMCNKIVEMDSWSDATDSILIPIMENVNCKSDKMFYMTKCSVPGCPWRRISYTVKSLIKRYKDIASKDVPRGDNGGPLVKHMLQTHGRTDIEQTRYMPMWKIDTSYHKAHKLINILENLYGGNLNTVLRNSKVQESKQRMCTTGDLIGSDGERLPFIELHTKSKGILTLGLNKNDNTSQELTKLETKLKKEQGKNIQLAKVNEELKKEIKNKTIDWNKSIQETNEELHEERIKNLEQEKALQESNKNLKEAQDNCCKLENTNKELTKLIENYKKELEQIKQQQKEEYPRKRPCLREEQIKEIQKALNCTVRMVCESFDSDHKENEDWPVTKVSNIPPLTSEHTEELKGNNKKPKSPENNRGKNLNLMNKEEITEILETDDEEWDLGTEFNEMKKSNMNNIRL